MLSSSCAGPTRVEAPSPGFSLPLQTLFNFINWLLSHSLANVVVGGSERVGLGWGFYSASPPHATLSCPTVLLYVVLGWGLRAGGSQPSG